MIRNFDRPILRYPGSKYRISKWIVSHFPKADSFLDLFLGGGGGIWHNLPRYPLETAVEIDGEITNFFQQIRTNSDKLLEAINWTLWSDLELTLCYQPCDDPLERARRTYVRSAMSISGVGRYKGGYRLIKSYSKSGHIPVQSEFVTLDHLRQAADRFRGVQIRNVSAFDILPKFLNQPSTLIYADPPYKLNTRHRKYYKHEFAEEQHYKLAVLLKEHQGPVLVSGKPDAQYKEWYEDAGWQVSQMKSRSQTGKTDQIETLWINPVAQEMLKKGNCYE